MEEILDMFSESHGKDDDHNEKVNSLLLHLFFSKSKHEIRDICKRLYAIEMKIHKCDKSEIFCCLHKNMEAWVIESILNNQFPGLINKFMNYLQKFWSIKIFVSLA